MSESGGVTGGVTAGVTGGVTGGGADGAAAVVPVGFVTVLHTVNGSHILFCVSE